MAIDLEKCLTCPVAESFVNNSKGPADRLTEAIFPGMYNLFVVMAPLFCVTITSALILYGIGQVLTDTTAAEADVDSLNLINGDFISTIAMGILGIALMMEGVKIANAIAVTILDSTSTSLVAAQSTLVAGVAARSAHGTVGKVGSQAQGA